MEVVPTGECSSKRVPLEDLSKDELILKYRSLLTIAHKAKQAKDTLIEENNELKDKLATSDPNLTNNEIIETLTQQKLNSVTALEELKNKTRILEAKFVDCQAKLDVAEEKISELDTVNQSYKRQVSRLTDENELLIVHLDKLEKQTEELKKIGMEQQEQLLALEKCNTLVPLSVSENIQECHNNEIIELQKMLSVSLEEVKKLQNENIKLVENISDVEIVLTEKENNIRIIGEELIEKNSTIENLKTRINELNQLVKEKEVSLYEDNRKLQNIIEKTQESITESANHLRNYKEQVEEKDRQIEKHMNIVDDLNTELHKNRALVEKLKMDITSTSNKLSDNQIMSSGITSDLQNANDKLKNKLKSYHTKIVRFAGDVKLLKQSKNELISTFKTYTETVSHWKDQLNTLLKHIKDKELENKALQKQNNFLNDSLIVLQDKNETLNENIQKLIEEAESNNTTLKMANDKNSELLVEKSKLEYDLQELWNKYNTINEELTAVKDQTQSDKSDSCERTKQELQPDIEIRSSQSTEIIQQNENKLQCEFDLLHSKYVALNEKFSDQMEELSQLKAKEIILTNEIEELKKEVLIKMEMLADQHKILDEKAQLVRTNQELNNFISDNEKVVSHFKETNERILNQNQNLLETNHNLKARLEQFELEMLIQIDDFNKKVGEYAENYTTKISDLCIKINNLERDSLTYAQTNTKLITENGNLQIVQEELNQQISLLRGQLQENEDVIKQQQDKLTSLIQTNQELHTKIDKSKSTESQLAERSGEEIIKLVNENKNLKHEINVLEQKLQEIENYKSNMVEVNIQTNTECSINDYEEKINSLKRENQELLSEMNEMNQALKERGETISKQQAYYDETLKKMQSYEAQANKNADAINKKENLIQELQQEISSLKIINKSNNVELINENILLKKDEEIVELNNEIQELHDKLLNISGQLDMTQETNYAESENMSTSTISKTDEATRMKDLESSWEERYGKLRLLALKLKSKIRDLTAELSKEQSEKVEAQQKLTKTIQMFQQQIDKLQDDLELCKSENKIYLKKLDVIALDISKDKQQLATNEELILSLKSEVDGLNKDKLNTENWKKQVSSKVQTLKKELEANTVVKRDFENKINKLNSELESKDKALKAEMDKHNETRSILQESNNECKKQSVLTLEMQDYEKSVKELSQKLDKKQELISKLKTQLDSQKSTMNILKDQNKLLEDGAKSFENELQTAKSEINLQQKKISDIENIISEKERKIQELMLSLENTRSENEDLSTQLSKTAAEHQKIHNSIKTERDYLKSKNMGLEQSLREIQGNLKLKEDELKEIKNEYNSYKVRAQSVLRQNQSRDVGTEERLTEEAATLKAQVEVLATELLELRVNIEKRAAENNNISVEKEEMMNVIQSYKNQIEENKNQIEMMSTKYQNTIIEHADTVRGLKVHADTLAQCYRQQISELEIRYNREIIDLQGKIDKGNTPTDFPSLVPPSMTREEGEGSESVESSSNNGANLVSLEKLLNTDYDQEIKFIKKQLAENESKVAHLTALLADTEQDLVKHVQMNKVLKEEIRRHQRSLEREEHAENLEYLKNVIFKFITLSNGDERMRLVPVLNTILKLSPEETQKLNIVARNDNSWSTYIASWGSSNKPQ